MKNPKYRSPIAVLVLIVGMILVLACASTTSKLAEAASTATPSSSQESSGQASAEQPVVASPTNEPGEMEPTEKAATSTPMSAPTSEPIPAFVTSKGFGQDGQEVGYAFVVQNPNEGHAVGSIGYQLAAYDEDGVVVETDSGYIDVLLPSQMLGVGGTVYVDEGVAVSEIEVQLGKGDYVASDPIPTFTIDSVAYYPDDFTPCVTGVLHSPYNADVTDVRISAVAYNEAGEIIGGGFSYTSFVLANGTTGAKASVTSAGNVDRVDLYGCTSGLSMLSSEDEQPGDATDLVLKNYGFGQDGSQCGFGLVVQNPNNQYSVESTQYCIVAFADNEQVLEMDEGYIEVLLPGQTLGVAGDLYLGQDQRIDHVDAQIKAGDYVEAEPLPWFTTENVSFQPGDWTSHVTGHIVSPYTQDVTNVRASAIGYNEAGEIIGGGFTFVDFVPAEGKAAADVSVTMGGTPTAVELYAAPSSLSDFE